MVFFHRYHCRQLYFPSNLSISLSPTSVTTRSDRCYHRKFNPKPSYFHNFWRRVAAVHEEAKTERECKTDHHSSSIARPQGAAYEGSVTQMLWYIYAPPQNRPDQGMLNRYFPSRETPRRWLVRSCTSYPQGEVVVGGVISWTRTLRHEGSSTPRKKTEYITCGTSPTCAAPKIRRFHTEEDKKEKNILQQSS